MLVLESITAAIFTCHVSKLFTGKEEEEEVASFVFSEEQKFKIWQI